VDGKPRRGRREFVEGISAALGDRARHRHVEVLGGTHVLRDPSASYGPTLRAETEPLDPTFRTSRTSFGWDFLQVSDAA
jgi:hypothetical protein